MSDLRTAVERGELDVERLAEALRMAGWLFDVGGSLDTAEVRHREAKRIAAEYARLGGVGE